MTAIQFIYGDPPRRSSSPKWLAIYRDFAAMPAEEHQDRWALLETLATHNKASWHVNRARDEFALECACRKTTTGEIAIYARHLTRKAMAA